MFENKGLIYIYKAYDKSFFTIIEENESKEKGKLDIQTYTSEHKKRWWDRILSHFFPLFLFVSFFFIMWVCKATKIPPNIYIKKTNSREQSFVERLLLKCILIDHDRDITSIKISLRDISILNFFLSINNQTGLVQ